MADQPSIFEQEQNTNTSTQTNNVSDPKTTDTSTQTMQLTDLLNSIKNERGEPKYKDPTEALKALQHSQEFIPQLKQQLTEREQEMETLKAEVARLKAVEDSVQQLTQRQLETKETPKDSITSEQIAEIVANQMKQRDFEQVQKANIETVKSTLLNAFGSDAEKQLYGKAEELGLTREEINQLVATKPKVVLTMLGVKDTQKKSTGFQGAAQGSVNTAAFQPQEETYLGRNPHSALLGATTEQMGQAAERANKMVDEVHAQGYTMHDLSDPKVYNRIFNKK